MATALESLPSISSKASPSPKVLLSSPSSGSAPLALIKSKNNINNGGGSSSFGLVSTIRAALVGTMFLVVIMQLHLSVNKAYGGGEEACHSSHNPHFGLQPLDSPLVLGNTANRTKEAAAALQRKIITNQESTPASALSSTLSPRASTTNNQQQRGLNAPGSKKLPEVNEKGVIIFYLHVPKTGGTTMMAPFERNPHWRYRMVYGFNKQEKYREEMYETLESWQPGMKIFYEYHAGRASAYMDLQVREDLLKWRAMAQVRQIPVFAFTVLREPLSFAVSHFNYYYAERKKDDNRYFYVSHPTEEDFVRLTLPNPQCLFCVHTEVAYYKDYREKGNPIHVPKDGCEAVYQAFVNDFDWIGTTESLSMETFPILEQVANVKYLPFVKNKSKDKISKKTLSQSAIDHVRNITQYDLDMYQRAQLDFPLSMWSNFDPSVHRPKKLDFPHLEMKQFEKPDLLGHEQRKKEREQRLRLKREKQ